MFCCCNHFSEDLRSHSTQIMLSNALFLPQQNYLITLLDEYCCSIFDKLLISHRELRH